MSRTLSQSFPSQPQYQQYLHLQKACCIVSNVSFKDTRKGQSRILGKAKGPSFPLTFLYPHGNLTGISTGHIPNQTAFPTPASHQMMTQFF